MLILRNKSMTVWMMTFSKPKEGGEMLRKLRDLFKDESGQDIMEYALLAAFISIVAVATIELIGPFVVAFYEDVRLALGGV